MPPGGEPDAPLPRTWAALRWMERFSWGIFAVGVLVSGAGSGLLWAEAMGDLGMFLMKASGYFFIAAASVRSVPYVLRDILIQADVEARAARQKPPRPRLHRLEAVLQWIVPRRAYERYFAQTLEDYRTEWQGEACPIRRAWLTGVCIASLLSIGIASGWRILAALLSWLN